MSDFVDHEDEARRGAYLLARLPDRGVVCVHGKDAKPFLQGLVTNELKWSQTAKHAGSQVPLFAGLLTPQGKILFDFLVCDEGWNNDHLQEQMPYPRLHLDVALDQAEALVDRLNRYKLRASVKIEITSNVCVCASWLDETTTGDAPYASGTLGLLTVDPRHPALGTRFIWSNEEWNLESRDNQAVVRSAADYHAHRIALGIPEGGKDYDFGDAFPHEANFDLINGVSFTKGCYVGQEIVARMQHRGTVRKRVVRVRGAAELPATRPEVTMGDAAIGRLGSVAGAAGLALIRLDRAIEAIDKGVPVTADGIALEVDPIMIARHRKVMAEKAGNP